MKPTARLIILSLLTSLSLQVKGQPHCDVRTFNIRNGLAANTISGIAQTWDDLMWFSTWNGLCCYDGYSFSAYRSSPVKGKMLSTNRIGMIGASQTGSVWCCTYDNHLYLYDTRQAAFVDVSKKIDEMMGHAVLVRKVYPLRDGYTWVTTKGDSELFRIKDSDLTVEAVSPAGVGNTCVVKKVERDSRGREWVFTDKFVWAYGTQYRTGVPVEYMAETNSQLIFASEDGQVLVFDGNRFRRHKLPVRLKHVNDMSTIGDENIAIASDAGVLMLNLADGTSQLIPLLTKENATPKALSVYPDSQGRVWAFGEGRGVAMIDSDRTLRWLSQPPAAGINTTAAARPFVHEDSEHTIWLVPTDGYFCYYDERTRSLVGYQLESLSVETGSLPVINKFFIDRQRNLWFTGTHDITLVNFRNRNISFVPTIRGQEARSLLFDSSEHLWVGMYEGELMCYSSEGKLMGYLSPAGRLQQQPVRLSNRIYSLFEDSRKRLWIGTKGDGIYVLSPSSKLQHFMPDSTDAYSLSHANIYGFDEDTRGRVWVATYGGGLCMVDEQTPGSLRFIHHANELKNYPIDNFSQVRRITHTKDGVMLVSTNSGLITFSDREKRIADTKFYVNCRKEGSTTGLFANDVLQTLVSRQGRIFLITVGGGVQEIVSRQLLTNDLELRRITTFRYDGGMVVSILEDKDGHLWMIRESCMERLNLRTEEIGQYGPVELGRQTSFSEALPTYNAEQGCMAAGVMGGFVFFHPDELQENTFQPNVVFTGVSYQGDDNIYPLFNVEEFDVPRNHRNLTIYFSALDYTTDNYQIRYAYKLEGRDDNWNYVGSQHSASFNNLPPGHLKLLVRSTNSAGIWSNDVFVLRIYSHPTFWETPWSWLFWLLVFAAALFLGIYVYRLRSKARMERELNDMKTQFYTDVSHKLRTPLTLIGGPVDQVLATSELSASSRKHLEMVSRNARRMLDLVNKMLHYSSARGVFVSEDVSSNDHVDDSTHIPPISPVRGTEADYLPSPSTRLLVVEDNDDLREYLCSILSDEYDVLTAADGSQGLEVAEREQPDFIITDVTMPVMDGLTMVHRIKQNNNICHIPIIVLSAKASLDDRLQGLREGIDDYITKPFSAIYLKTRIRNIISQRETLQQSYLEQLSATQADTVAHCREYKLQSPKIVDADSQMMEKLLAFLDEHIADADMKVDDMADAVCLGRSVFYGKLKSIVGMSPVDFLRHLRIQQAEELVTKSGYSFSQIAYQVGFSDPKYFSKCFKKETGMTPTEYREKAK